jgi:hypothetical protein
MLKLRIKMLLVLQSCDLNARDCSSEQREFHLSKKGSYSEEKAPEVELWQEPVLGLDLYRFH